MPQNEEPVPLIRKMLRYTTFAIIVALGYLGWVFYSRWHENRLLQQQAAAKEKAEARRIYEMYAPGE